jgi:hypothetical protein
MQDAELLAKTYRTHKIACPRFPDPIHGAAFVPESETNLAGRRMARLCSCRFTLNFVLIIFIYRLFPSWMADGATLYRLIL